MVEIFIETALQEATYHELDDGSVVGYIVSCPRVVARSESLQQCALALRAKLEEEMNEWFRMGRRLPRLRGFPLDRLSAEEPLLARLLVPAPQERRSAPAPVSQGSVQLCYTDDMAQAKKKPDANPESPRGPRGGRTTVSADGALVRKTFYIDREVEEVLREESFRTRKTEAEIVRWILRDHYGIE